jgi:DNA-binding MarR family transcriptional regulator
LRSPRHASVETIPPSLTSARGAGADPLGEQRGETLLAGLAQHVGANGTRVTELAARAWLTKATVVPAVDELERLGYVTREPDPGDRRAKLVVPTARAREAEQVARRAIADVREAWAELIGEEEMDGLEAGLRQLRAGLWPPS